MKQDTLYHLDYETRSAANLLQVGAFPYAEHESTTILMFAIAKDDGDPLLWDIFNTFGQNDKASRMFQDAVLGNFRICAHNYQFEHAISKYVLPRQSKNLLAPNLDSWRCTAAMCRSVAIPHSLAQASEFLGLDQQKDSEGKRLIKKFSIMAPGDPEIPKRVTEEDARDWELFCKYCVQDVKTEQHIYNKLRAVEFDLPKNKAMLASFQFDAHMNDRGIPIDIDTANKVISRVAKHKEKLAVKFKKLTGYNPTQRAKFLAWVTDRGYKASNLQSTTVDKTIRLGYLKGDAAKAMFLYSQQSFAAVAKLDVMVRCANSDGRIRGTLSWCGAIRTGRWSGQKLQPQNMRKPSLKNVRGLAKDEYMAIECARAFEWLKKDKSPKAFEAEWGCPYLEVVASVIRQFIQEPDGEILNADYSSIEARLVPFIVGDAEQLKAYAEGADLYNDLASKIYGVDIEEVNGAQRFIGKIGVLGCCYGIGPVGFAKMLDAWGWEPSDEDIQGYVDSPEPVVVSRAGKKVKIILTERKAIMRYLRGKIASRVVKIYRDANPLVSSAWKAAGSASMGAVMNPNKIFKILDGRVQFLCNSSLGFPALRMRLPSGKTLTYPCPSIEKELREFEDDEGEKYTREVDVLTFFGKMFNGSAWGRTSTYGAKLIENVAQGLCADVMSHGGVTAHNKGYKIWMLVHDEALCSAKDGDLKGFTDALCDVPEWLPNFPLESDGAKLPYYTK